MGREGVRKRFLCSEHLAANEPQRTGQKEAESSRAFEFVLTFIRAAADQSVEPPHRYGGGRTYKRRGLIKRYTQHPEWRVWAFRVDPYRSESLMVTADGVLVKSEHTYDSDWLRQEIVNRASNNPSYVENLIASLHENLERYGVEWPSTAPPLPPPTAGATFRLSR